MATTAKKKARWGVGALIYENQENALPGEIIVDHEAGILGVKSYNGETGSTDQIVSFEYLERVKNSCMTFKQLLLDEGIDDGVVYKIDLYDHIGPSLILNNKYYALTDMRITNEKVKFIRFYFDIEVINIVSGLSVPIVPNITMDIEIAQLISNLTNRKVISETNVSLDVINSKTFIPNYTGFVSTSYTQNLFLSSFKLVLPEEEAETHKIILYSLFAGFKEV